MEESDQMEEGDKKKVYLVRCENCGVEREVLEWPIKHLKLNCSSCGTELSDENVLGV